ncbi:hypothetical protein NNL21_35030 [Paenibacillus mendelii]|nr:hypothetical protein [Paenibacillus mendelii]
MDAVFLAPEETGTEHPLLGYNNIEAEGNEMKKKQYELNFKKTVVTKGKEIGNMTAVARQHELDPKMVRWARELDRKDIE